jgi:putative transposase
VQKGMSANGHKRTHALQQTAPTLLNGEIFYSLKEAQIVIEQWRKHYNTIRPHSALNYRPPAPQTFVPLARHLDEIMAMQ